MLDFIRLFLVLLLWLQVKNTGAFKCFECASGELKSRWHVTGFPVLVETFDSDICATPPDDPLEVAKVVKDCDSFCVTFAMSAIDDNGDIAVKDTSFIDGRKVTDPKNLKWNVRGCFNTLMGSDVDTKARTDLKSTEFKCVAGEQTFHNNKTEPRSAKVAMESCIDETAPCNKKSISLEGATADCPKASQKQRCRKSPENGGSSCDGVFCYKYDVWINNKKTLTKGCSDINPYLPPASKYNNLDTKISQCATSRTNTYMPTRANNEIVATKCFCSTGNDCNGSHQVQGTIFTILSTVFLACIFYLY